MTDLEKARTIQTKFAEAISSGCSKEEASHGAIKNSLNGFEKGEYGGITLAYCGEYLVLFEGKGSIFKEIKQLVKKEIRDYAEDVASCSRPAEHVDDAIRCIDNL